MKLYHIVLGVTCAMEYSGCTLSKSSGPLGEHITETDNLRKRISDTIVEKHNQTIGVDHGTEKHMEHHAYGTSQHRSQHHVLLEKHSDSAQKNRKRKVRNHWYQIWRRS